MNTTDITVPVPVDRVPDFYRWFADWVETAEQVTPLDVRAAASGLEDETVVAAATRWWELLTSRERQIFGLWIDAAPKLIPADRIVEEMQLNGTRDIPGILSWPSRKGKKVGFHATWRFRSDSATGVPLYGIDDIAYADLLSRARSATEGE